VSFLETQAFTAAYPDAPARLAHSLAGHPLFEIARLLDLARALPAKSLEYNSGDLPIGQDPAKTPANGLSAEETVRRIADCRSWMVLKNVEQDGEYADLMRGALASLASDIEIATGSMRRCEAFVFLSSPGAVTPFHMDPEHNILMQVRGRKTFWVYPARDAEIVSDRQHEAYHGDGHRNLPWRREFETKAAAHDLGPGDAIYVPVKAPHRVRNGDDVSVSFSITWRSHASESEARLRHANRLLRRLGARPASPGRIPALDAAKDAAFRAASRLAPARR
jgi:quercetin dioxygenase-like cupin family protein